VTDWLKALPGNGSVNKLQHAQYSCVFYVVRATQQYASIGRQRRGKHSFAAIEEAVFSVWSVRRLYKESLCS
jgi:hypothetical protein